MWQFNGTNSISEAQLCSALQVKMASASYKSDVKGSSNSVRAALDKCGVPVGSAIDRTLFKQLVSIPFACAHKSVLHLLRSLKLLLANISGVGHRFVKKRCYTYCFQRT